MFDFSTAYGAPKCIKVKTTQSVQFTGISTSHPIGAQECGPTPVITASTTPITKTFPTVGTYGAICTVYATPGTNGAFMAVAVQVVP